MGAFFLNQYGLAVVPISAGLASTQAPRPH